MKRIVSGETSTIIKVPNQRKSEKKESERKKKTFSQMENQLMILQDRPNLKNGNPRTEIFGNNLKSMSGTLLLGSKKESSKKQTLFS